MRRAAKVDRNQAEIVRALRQAGASVQPMHTLGQGVPDLLVGYRCKNFIMEIKNPKQSKRDQLLTPDEKAWHYDWKGTAWIVKSAEEALKLLQEIP